MLTESEAIGRAKEKDLSGLRVLVELHQQEALRLVALIVGDRQLAEDVVSDSFLMAFDHIAQFDERRPFFPWFRRILVNNALKRIKRRNRFLPLNSHGSADTNVVDYLASLPDPSDAVEETEMKTDVRRAINSLSPQQRAVIVLRYYYDLSEAEIAQTLNIPGGTVKSRAAAGVKRLGGLLSGIRSSLPNLF
jgi:RNA polymerase sigma-70 factor (ECF subfamily)